VLGIDQVEERQSISKNMKSEEDKLFRLPPLVNLILKVGPDSKYTKDRRGTLQFYNAQQIEFTNSRLQLHEFIISTSRIHDFNLMNSRF
jgi:hypothetical protein